MYNGGRKLASAYVALVIGAVAAPSRAVLTSVLPMKNAPESLTSKAMYACSSTTIADTHSGRLICLWMETCFPRGSRTRNAAKLKNR